MARCLLFCACALWVTPLRAQNDTDPTEPPVAVWHFDAPTEAGVTKADAKFLDPGPRPPSYPSFKAGNTAMLFSAAHPSIKVREADLPKANGLAPGTNSWLRARLR